MASSVASASSTTILTSLPARPPTPPRETSHEVDPSVKSAVLGRNLAFDPRLSLQTPPNANCPTSPAATESNLSSSRTRKKVEWSAHTQYREPPQYLDCLKPVRSSPPSAASSASSRPVKGILKPSSSPNPLASTIVHDLNGTPSEPNIIEMLDSTIKQLAGSDRESKLDAYMMLSRGLKASNNLPDRVALQGKMSLFMQFIQRDMVAKSESGSFDASLVNHSLTLLATLLHFPAIASTLTTDFGVFVTDHAIRSFEDPAVPKDIIRHLMQVIAFQNFPAKVMTSERVGRLVSALHNIENHLKGKSIIMSRLHIYKRLVNQARNHMIANLDWLKDMFADMLSSVKDIRAQAITLGTEAGFAMRSEKQLLRKVTEIFQTTYDDETYIDFYIRKLQGMIKERQSSSAVPQIWSVVILFLRCPLDKWQYYGPWLTLVQSAFNMTDSSTKQEANFAWNRYIYLSLTDSRIGPKAISTLCQPLLSQLRRKISPKQHDEAMKLRRVVISGICNLYYYAFAPASDKYSPDVIWEVAVQPIIAQLIGQDGKPDSPGDGTMQAAKLLVGLLDVTTPRVWRQDRIMDLPPVRSDELPAMDSKWIRRNCDKVLECVHPIITNKFSDLANKDSLIYRLWEAIVGSVTAASAKDIKVSEDTAKFVGLSLGLLSKVLSPDSSTPEGAIPQQKMLASVSNYVTLLVDGLGILPFTEKKLSMKAPHIFEPVATPSQRHDSADNNSIGMGRIPLYHLFSLMSAVPPGCADDGDLATFFQSVFQPFLKGRNDKSKMNMCRELIQLLPRNALSPLGPWLLAADSVKTFLERGMPATGTNPILTDKLLGPEYREVVSLLERGLTSHPNLPPSQWLALFDAISSQIIRDFGDAGCSLIVIEPLAKFVFDIFAAADDGPTSLIWQAIKALFATAKLPRDRQALEAARSRLWGAPSTSTKALSADPFDHLYKLGNGVLQRSYAKFSTFNAELEIAPIMEALDAFLVKCLPQGGTRILSMLQDGLRVWIEDLETKLQPTEQSPVPSLITKLWDHICSELRSHGRLDKQEFDQVEQLLMAAFQSTSVSIVNRTALTWNVLVQDDEEVGCSDSLLSVVSSLTTKLELVVPGADKPNGGFGAQALSVSRSKDDLSVQELSSASSHAQTGKSEAAKLKKPMTRKRRLDMITEVSREKPAKGSTAPRLRHDNSQIQFQPVDSSSPPNDESQHLTTRQKEVREKQRQNSALYSEVQPSSPSVSSQSLPKQDDAGSPPRHKQQVEESTPKQAKSYEELISSTPTPRRGQVLQLEDFNDPPSSPPIPRPYPLLSEIQSRSRAGSTMEDWEFSSPPGSPGGNHQPEQDNLLQKDTPEQALPVKPRRSSKRQRRSAAKSRQSSHIGTPQQAAESDIGLLEREPGTVQESSSLDTTVPQGVMTRARRAQEPTDSVGSTLAKSHSTSQRRTSRRMEAKIKAEDPAGQQKPVLNDTIDKVSHSSNIAFRAPVVEESIAGSIKQKVPQAVTSYECITVHTDAPSQSAAPLPAAVDAPMSPAVPSTPPDQADVEASSGSRRKRKRGAKHGSRNKRRRTLEAGITQDEGHEHLSSSVAQLPRESNSLVEGVETRSGTRRQRRQTTSNATPTQNSSPYKQAAHTDGGDTDEELFSQLVTESNAASQQSQIVDQVSDETDKQPNEGTNEAADPAPNVTLPEPKTVEPRAPTPGTGTGHKTLTIMDTLRSGLDQLRSVSLTRERVYEVEDILMDLKRELFEAERRGRGRSKKRKSLRR